MTNFTFGIFQVPFDWNLTKVWKFVSRGDKINRSELSAKSFSNDCFSSKGFPNLIKLPQEKSNIST